MNYAEKIPLADELVAEQPPPYQRRQKAVSVRRGRRRTATRLLKAGIFAVLLPLGVFAGGYCVAIRSTRSTCFQFNPERDVTVQGSHFASPQDLTSELGFGSFGAGEGRTIFGLNLAAEARRVERIPWVESATVSRVLPNRLVVNVIERTPLAFANVSGRLMLIDRHGVFLPMPEKAAFDFPVVHGLDAAADPAGRERLLEPYVGFLQDVGNAVVRSGWSISEAGVADPSDLQLLLVQGNETILVHFGDQDFDQRFETFATLAPRVIAANPRINSMDLRYHDEVVVDPSIAATMASPAPAATAQDTGAEPAQQTPAK
ncbi:MAG: cell division protein FtsQ/DivIB [Terriglobia bacterium]